MSSYLRIAPTAFFVWMIALAGQSPQSLAVTWVVDGDRADCSDAGSGAANDPLCSIKEGASRAVAGDTVLVHPAVYPEQITVPRSGAPGLPITYRAQGAGVLILGTDDLSDPASWSPAGTSAWSRSFSPASPPKQAFLDSARLAAAPARGSASVESSALGRRDIVQVADSEGRQGPAGAPGTPASFLYDPLAKVLYVDIGGPNPAEGHVVQAGARSYGFSLVGKSHVVIEGFEIRRQNHTGVRLAAGSSNVVVRGTAISHTGVYGILSDAGAGPILIEANEVSHAGSAGIKLLNSTGVTVSGNVSRANANHGLTLHGSSGNAIVGNVSYWNARPDVRAATGLDVNTSSVGNIIRANTFFENQDSGCQIYNGSHDNLVVRNVSYRNGDHGFDTNHSSGTRYVSNTSQGNFKSGFSVEGSSTGSVLANNIAADNGLRTDESDLYVDPSSAAGFVSDYDIFYRSGPGGVVDFGDVDYPTIEDFAAATGQEAHGLGEDPLFVDPASGDLRLAPGPAVDSADSGANGFSAMDRDGSGPLDISGIANTGAGEIPYADRGALELDDPLLAVSPRDRLEDPWSRPVPETVRER